MEKIKDGSKEFPMRIEIEPTNECNSSCSYCPRKFMKCKTGFMDMALYARIIDEVRAYQDRTLVIFRRGEALLHPEFIKMLYYTKDKFKDIQLATNASLMDRKLAKAIAETVTFLSFSLELPERYRRYRQLDYSTVMENISYFLSLNSKNKIGTQVSIVKTEDITDEEISMFINEWQNKVDRVRVYEEHSADGKFGSLKIPRANRQPCIKPFNDILIFWDGKVGRCNHDWGAQPLGSIVNSSIRDIWQGDTYNKLRRQHSEIAISDKVCKDCDSWYENIGDCEIGETYEKGI